MADDFGSIPIDVPEKANTPKSSRKRRKKVTSTPSKSIPREPQLSIEPQDETTVSTIEVRLPPNTSEQTLQEDTQERTDEGSRKTPVAKQSPKKSHPLRYAALFFTVCLLLLVGIYSFAGFVGIPHVLKQNINEYFANNTHLTIKDHDIRFNPYTFALELQNIEIGNESNQQNSTLVTIASIQAQLDSKALLQRKIVFSEFTINAPEVSLSRERDGSYNFGKDLLTQDQKTLNRLAEIPFLFAVKNIAIKEGRFTFNDEPTTTLHKGEHISAFYPGFGNFDFPRDALLPPSFSATINGSPVHFAQSADSATMDKVAMNVDNMDLGLYLNYLPITVPFDIKKSNAQGQFELFFSQSKMGKELLTIGFHVDAQDIKLDHRSKQAQLNMDQLTIDAEYQPFSRDLNIKELNVVEPTLDIKEHIELSEIASLLPTKFLQTEANRLCLEKFTIKDGSINIAGKSGTQLNNLQLTLSGYENSETDILSPLSFTFQNLSDKSTVSWQGQLISGHAEGELLWKNIPIETVLQFTQAPVSSRDKGRADISGPLTIKRNLSKGTFTTLLGKGDIQLSNVELYSKDVLWLKTDKIDIAHVNLSEEKKILGDITITKGNIFIDGNQLPPILSKISQKNSSLSSLDFTGTAKITKKGLPTLDIKRLKLYADKLDQDQLSADNLQISALFSDNATVTAKGRGKISPFSLWLGVNFSQLKSQEALAWFCTEKVFSETNSKISGSGRLILPSLSFKGDIQSGPATVKQNGKTLFKWQANSVKDLEYKASDKSLNISSITVKKPTFTWNRGPKEPAIYSKTRNFMVNLLGEYGVNKTAPLKSLKIRKISFSDGNLTIRDQRFDKPWNGRISSFAGTLEAIDSTNKTTPFVFNYSGAFAKSTIRLQGNAEVFSPTPHHEFTLTLKNFPPATFAAQLPELRKQTTLPSFVDLKIYQKSSKDKINTITDIVLKKLTPKNNKEALVLALLRGTKEQATISLLSQNSELEEDVPLISNIEKQINKLLVKAEISPFLLVDKKYADLVSLSFVEYRFGELSPTGKATKELMHLRDFLNDYPQLSLVIQGEASLNVDRSAMQKQLQESETKRVEAVNARRLAKWKKEQDPLMPEQSDEDFVEQNIFIPLQPENVQVPQKMLIDLANQRAEILQKTLINQLGLDKNRIIVQKTKELSENSSNIARFSLTAKP